MDIRKVKKLIDLLDESGIHEIEIHEGEESVRITRSCTRHAQTYHRPADACAGSRPPAPPGRHPGRGPGTGRCRGTA
jgi:acetyl-CoA carboxylase biotin carboxyl carrier protein